MFKFIYIWKYCLHVFLQTIFRSEGVNDLTPISLSSSLKNIGILCTIPFTGELCKSILFTIFGPSVQYFDGVILNLSKHYPAGSSYKQFVHFGQLIATGNKHSGVHCQCTGTFIFRRKEKKKKRNNWELYVSEKFLPFSIFK